MRSVLVRLVFLVSFFSNGWANAQAIGSQAGAPDLGAAVVRKKDPATPTPATKPAAEAKPGDAAKPATPGTTKPVDPAAPKAPPPPPKKAKAAKPTLKCDGLSVQKPGIAMVSGDPKWRSPKDSDLPTNPVCGADEAAVVVGNTNYKFDQQCLDWHRGRAATDPNTWSKNNGLFAIAANVTQVGQEIRIWCVPTDQVIMQQYFGQLAKFGKMLLNTEGIDWNAVRDMIRQAPNFVTKQMMEKMLASFATEQKRLLKLVTEKVDRLETRMDNLEAMAVSFDIGAAGGYIYPGAGGGYLTLGLNVPFAAATWSFRLEAGGGAGQASGQLMPAFMFGTSLNRQLSDRVALGPNLRFQIFQMKSTGLAALTIGARLEVRLGGPDYSRMSADEVRDRNGKFAVEPNLFVTADIGGALIPVPGNYRLGLAIDTMGGLLLRIGKRHPVKKSISGEALAVLDQVRQEDSAAGEPIQE